MTLCKLDIMQIYCIIIHNVYMYNLKMYNYANYAFYTQIYCILGNDDVIYEVIARKFRASVEPF